MLRRFSLLALTAAALLAPTSAEATCTGWPANQSLWAGQSFHDQVNVGGLDTKLYYVSITSSGTAFITPMTVTAHPGGVFGNRQGFVGPGASLSINLTLHSSAVAGQSSTVTVVVIDSETNQVACGHTFTVTSRGGHCVPHAWWLNANPSGPGDGYWSDAWFDGANCYVKPVPPADGTAFVYDNKYYLSLGKNFICEAGWYDGANCYLGAAPAGKTGFVYNGAFYYID